jgi:hypothetical protein
MGRRRNSSKVSLVLFVNSKILRLSNECALFGELNDALNSTPNGGFEFLLWQTGVECNLQAHYLFSLKVV